MDTLYKQYIIDHYKSPRNYGRIVGADSTVMVENLSCGDKIELFLKFDDNGSIREVKFEASGCAICIATMSMLSERVIGLNKDQVKKISKESVLNLTGLSELSGRVKCGLIAWDAVNASINGKRQYTP